jgi:hypothetical protein
MSDLKSSMRKTRLFVLLIFIFSGWQGVAAENDGAAISFYLKKVDSVFSSSYIFDRGIDFLFKARAIYYKMDYRGNIRKADTAIYDIAYGSDGQRSADIIDSAAMAENIVPADFHFPRPWRDTLGYHLYFFPNDTGSGPLAIGFEGQMQDKGENPSGFFLIDRNHYVVNSMVTDFHKSEGDKTLSGSLRFGTLREFIIIDRLEINESEILFTGTSYFKRILEFYDYRIGKQ